MNTSRVRHVRLINGEEIVARLGEETENEWIFVDPYVIEDVVMEDGSEVITLARYIPHTEDQVSISKDKVMTITPVIDAFEKYYEVSRVYSKTFFEDNATKEIEKVTRMMENIMDSHSGKNVRRANGEVIFVHPAFLQTSNSQH
jgi:hypothetical protein